MALHKRSRALRYYQTGFLDSVFFLLSPLSLDSILLVNVHRQAAFWF